MERHHKVIKYNYDKYLSVFGIDYSIMRKTRSGTRCECWDNIRASSRSDCPTCMGSGFADGYETLITIKASETDVPKISNEVIIPQMQGSVSQTASVWTNSDYVVTAGDLMCKPSGDVYEVLQCVYINNTNKLRQVISMRELLTSDARYDKFKDVK